MSFVTATLSTILVDHHYRLQFHRATSLFLVMLATLSLLPLLALGHEDTEHVRKSFPLQHQIHNLPGFGPLTTRMWNGWIAVGPNGKRRIHYIHTEAEINHRNAPLILWLQGGPGGSSLIGMFTENGPFSLSDQSLLLSPPDLPPVLFRNPFSWNKVANMVFIESPASVGFSDCGGDCPVWDDKLVAKDTYDFIQGFFRIYKHYSQIPFYVMGESYGGIYVPNVASLLLDHPGLVQNFKGVAVGNGCTSIDKEGPCGVDSAYYLLNFLVGHGQVSLRSFDELMSTCKESMKNKTKMSSSCRKRLENELNQAGGFNVYNLYDTCYQTGDELLLPKLGSSTLNFLQAGTTSASLTTCGSERMLVKYMNHKLVQTALGTKKLWNEIQEQMSFKLGGSDSRPIYRNLVKNNKRVLIYFGDTDTIVPYNSGEYMVSNLGLQVFEEWRPWTVEYMVKVAGYVTTYANGMLTFATIRGAGHMVPRYKPAEALTMVYNWLEEMPLPTFGGKSPYVTEYTADQDKLPNPPVSGDEYEQSESVAEDMNAVGGYDTQRFFNTPHKIFRGQNQTSKKEGTPGKHTLSGDSTGSLHLDDLPATLKDNLDEGFSEFSNILHIPIVRSSLFKEIPAASNTDQSDSAEEEIKIRMTSKPIDDKTHMQLNEM